MNPKSAPYTPHPLPPTQDWLALSLAISSTPTLLVSVALLWSLHLGILAEPGTGQTATGRQPEERLHAQVPVLTPADSLNLDPPLGYPEVPSEASPSGDFRSYRLGIGDAIAVTVQRFPDLNFQSFVDLQGNISVPLVGTLQAAGLTLEGAEAEIQRRLNRFVIDPAVNVALVGVRPAQVTVTGEVLRPGYYLLQPGSQLTAALFTAGGTTTVADLRTIVVRRQSPAGDRILEERVDLFTPLLNGTSLPELRLQDGDAVVVSKLEVGTTTDYDRNLVSRSSVTQPQINVRVLSYAGGGIGNLVLANGSTFVDALTAISPNLDNARVRRIALIRFDPEQGKAVTQELDGKRAIMGDISQNVPLQNNDVIVVGRNLIGRITYALNVFTQPFRDVLGFLLFFDSIQESATDLFRPGSNNDND